MNAAEVVARARAAIGRGCRYGLGKGGFRPGDPLPFGPSMLCDCSGFAAWCLGEKRKTDNPWYRDYNGGWIETTAIVRDCGTPYGMFAQVEPGLARGGDLIVYGDHRRADGGWSQGHVGVITEAAGGPLKAVHCSKGNQHKTGDAIQETGVALWLAAGGIVARCALVK